MSHVSKQANVATRIEKKLLTIAKDTQIQQNLDENKRGKKKLSLNSSRHHFVYPRKCNGQNYANKSWSTYLHVKILMLPKQSGSVSPFINLIRRKRCHKSKTSAAA